MPTRRELESSDEDCVSEEDVRAELAVAQGRGGAVGPTLCGVDQHEDGPTLCGLDQHGNMPTNGAVAGRAVGGAERAAKRCEHCGVRVEPGGEALGARVRVGQGGERLGVASR